MVYKIQQVRRYVGNGPESTLSISKTLNDFLCILFEGLTTGAGASFENVLSAVEKLMRSLSFLPECFFLLL